MILSVAFVFGLYASPFEGEPAIVRIVIQSCKLN
jgi:hypothetical protein